MNAHGKVDRAALERVAILEPARAHYEAPRTELERKLAQIWQRILKVERVGIHDDFFDLGGHSLVATRVASWIRDELEIDMPLKQLFDMPTVAQLSEYVENQIWLSGQEPPGRSDVVSAVH